MIEIHVVKCYQLAMYLCRLRISPVHVEVAELRPAFEAKIGGLSQVLMGVHY
jgi:hypothetical protein